MNYRTSSFTEREWVVADFRLQSQIFIAFLVNSSKYSRRKCKRLHVPRLKPGLYALTRPKFRFFARHPVFICRVARKYILYLFYMFCSTSQIFNSYRSALWLSRWIVYLLSGRTLVLLKEKIQVYWQWQNRCTRKLIRGENQEKQPDFTTSHDNSIASHMKI